MKITEDFTFFIVALMGLSFIIVMATIENSEHLKIACFESNKTYINQDGMEFCGDMGQIKELVNDINNIKQPPYDINRKPAGFYNHNEKETRYNRHF